MEYLMPEAIQSLDNLSSLLAALAATFSAIAAFLSWRTGKQNFRHSARPELVLNDWNRSPDPNTSSVPERISFSMIENVGRGPALHVYINSCSFADDGRPMTTMSTIQQSLIAPTSRASVPSEISIRWNTIPGSPGSKSAQISIDIFCWDTTGVRYHTQYNLVVVEQSPNVSVANEIAPVIMLMTRTVTIDEVWKLKMKSRLSKIPVFGSFFAEK